MTIPCAGECRVMDLRRQVAKADGNSHCIGNVNKSEDSGKHTARGVPPKRAISTHLWPLFMGFKAEANGQILDNQVSKIRRFYERNVTSVGNTRFSRRRNVLHPSEERVPSASGARSSDLRHALLSTTQKIV